MKTHQQTKELLTAVAHLLRDVDKAKADDRRISMPEAVGILTTNLGTLVTAVRGAGEIPAEATDFTEEELDDLYTTFLTEMEWEPTDHHRDLAAAYYQLIAAAYTNVLRILNTHRPPVAELAA